MLTRPASSNAALVVLPQPAIALFSFGSGPIKGFSVTLMIGILTSMFTAIIITKYLVLFYVKKKDINKIFY